MHTESKGRLQILVCSPSPDFPVYVYMPIVWLQLRHFCDQDEVLNQSLSWSLPIVFSRPDLLENDQELQKNDILALSGFIWSDSFNELLAKKYRTLRPDGLIVMGGPQVDTSDPKFFEKYSYVDVFVEGEGENAFAEILRRYLRSTNRKEPKIFADIPGVHIHGAINSTRYAERVKNYSVESYYQAYSEDLDKLIENVRQYSKQLYGESAKPTFTSMIESDRGCPYRCQFCSWGAPQGKKLTTFDIQRALTDLDWAFSRNHLVHYVNANVGLFPQDAKLFEAAGELKKKYQSTSWIWANWAKSDHHVDRVAQIASQAFHDGVMPSFKLSLQTTELAALTSAGRKNFSDKATQKLIRKMHENGVDVACELIVALPGDNLIAQRKTVADCLELGIHSLVMAPYVLLPASESNTAQYREKNRIKALWRPWMHYTEDTYEASIISNVELCVESYSYDRQEYIRMNAEAAMMSGLINRGVIMPHMWYFRNVEGVGYNELINHFFNSIQNSDRFPFWSDLYNSVLKVYTDYIEQTGKSIFYVEKHLSSELCQFAEGHSALRAFLNVEKSMRELSEIFVDFESVENAALMKDLESWTIQVHSEFEETSPYRRIFSRFDWSGFFFNFARFPSATKVRPGPYRDRVFVNEKAFGRWKGEPNLKARLQLFADEFIGKAYLAQPAALSLVKHSKLKQAQQDIQIVL